MSKHTAGKWKVGGMYKNLVHSDNATLVAVCKSYPTGFRDGSAEANAKLISAAPELLEALVIAEKMLCEQENAMRSLGRYNPCPEIAILTARAAIAKATGGN